MSLIPDIVPISELRQDAAGIVKKMKSSRKPVFITQRGRASAVMLSTESFERMQHEIELLKILARGEMEIEAGAGSDLDTVFKKADSLLASGE